MHHYYIIVINIFNSLYCILLKGSIVRDEILSEIRSAPCYSILIDETMDISTREQMVMYVKYILPPSADEEPIIKTRFLGIIEVRHNSFFLLRSMPSEQLG